MIPQPTPNATYLAYAELLLRRHCLVHEKGGDGLDVEQVEDDLSALWDELDDNQRRSVNGAGSDLNWVARHGEAPPKGRKPDDVTAEERASLAHAEGAEEWHAVLHYLRVCAPVLEIDDLARRRAAAYAGVGLLGYAEACQKLAGVSSRPATAGVE